MRIVLAALALTALTVSAHSEIGADAAQAILKIHNRERTALGIAPLSWDAKLADHAAVWAEHLAQLGKLQHTENSARPGEGENLWMGSTGSYSPTEMAEAWAAEKRYFRQGAFPYVTTGGNDWHVVGHYTQMIWRHSTAVGCAIAIGRAWDILVCRYSPPGNFIGEKPY